MKITIEGNTQELKEFLGDRNWNIPGVMECKEVEKPYGITREGNRITFRYGDKEWSLYKENEKKTDGDEYFTYDEAIEYCKELKDRHLPSIEERQELLKARCEWKGYKMDGTGVFGRDNGTMGIGEEFAKDFGLEFAGDRAYYDADVYDQDDRGYYWSSSPYGSDGPENARGLYLDPDYVDAYDYNERAYGFSVRCFKNSSS